MFPRSLLISTATLALALPVLSLPAPCIGNECLSLSERSYLTPPSAPHLKFKRQADFAGFGSFLGLFGGADKVADQVGSFVGDKASDLVGGLFDDDEDDAAAADDEDDLGDRIADGVGSFVKDQAKSFVGDLLGGDDEDEAPAAAAAAAAPAAANKQVAAAAKVNAPAAAAAAPPQVADAGDDVDLADADVADVANPPPDVADVEAPPPDVADVAAPPPDVADVEAPPPPDVAAAGTCASGAPGINAATVSLIQSFEGFVASPEPDPIGLPTAGFGHLCKQAGCAEVPFKFPLTPGATGTAAQLLQLDVAQFVKCIDDTISDSVVLTDNEQGALVAWAFNVGCGAAKKSTLAKRLNAGEDKATVIPQELPKFNKAGGKVLKGLTRRRKAEVDLFLTPSAVQAHPC